MKTHRNNPHSLKTVRSNTIQSNRRTAPAYRCFSCLYTHQKLKKKKSWNDGELRVYVSLKRCALYSKDENSITSAESLDSKYCTDSEIDRILNGLAERIETDKYLVEVESESNVNETVPQKAVNPEVAVPRHTTTRKVHPKPVLNKPFRIPRTVIPAATPSLNSDAPPRVDAKSSLPSENVGMKRGFYSIDDSELDEIWSNTHTSQLDDNNASARQERMCDNPRYCSPSPHVDGDGTSDITRYDEERNVWPVDPPHHITSLPEADDIAPADDVFSWGHTGFIDDNSNGSCEDHPRQKLCISASSTLDVDSAERYSSTQSPSQTHEFMSSVSKSGCMGLPKEKLCTSASSTLDVDSAGRYSSTQSPSQTHEFMSSVSKSSCMGLPKEKPCISASSTLDVDSAERYSSTQSPSQTHEFMSSVSKSGCMGLPKEKPCISASSTLDVDSAGRYSSTQSASQTHEFMSSAWTKSNHTSTVWNMMLDTSNESCAFSGAVDASSVNGYAALSCENSKFDDNLF